MIKNINRLIASLLIVALALYVVFMNRTTMTVRVTPGFAITSDMGIILIVIFCLGIICATLVALYFGFKGYLRERALKNKEKQRQLFMLQMLKARGLLAAGNWSKAREQWEQAVRRDSTDVIARVELSKCLEGNGDIRDALRIIDEARAAAPQNFEVLFRAAELNLALGNKTAAVDNLALVLAQENNEKASRRARDLSEEIERFDDALEYHSRLDSNYGASDVDQNVKVRLLYKKILQEAGQDAEKRALALRDFVKRNAGFAPAAAELARIEVQQGNHESAAQIYIKAAKVNQDPALWRAASSIWLDCKAPERALATARLAAKECEGSARLLVEVDLIRIYVALNMLEDACRAADGLKDLAQNQEVELPTALKHQALAFKALAQLKLNSARSCEETLRELCEQEILRAPSNISYGSSENGSAPSPTLSTP